MIPGPSGNVGGLPTSTTKGLSGDAQPLNLNTATGHVVYLRDRYRSHQLLEEAVKLMLNSWRTKTNKFYDLLYRPVAKAEILALRGTALDFAIFLTALFLFT